MKSEMELLLECCRLALYPSSSIKKIKQLIYSGIDWERFDSITREHGLMSCAFAEFSECYDQEIPAQLLSDLQNSLRLGAARAMHRANTLIQLMQKFESANIKVLTFKGPALAQLLYGNVTMRQFNDLDIIISPSDTMRAHQLLQSLGYELKRKLGYEHSFIHYSSKINVDLHWRLAADTFRMNFDFEEFWQRSRKIEINGKPVRTLSVEDTLLAQCINAAKEGWAYCRLRDIYEIAFFLQKETVNWDIYENLVKALGCQRISHLSFKLATDLFHVELPSAIDAKINSDRNVKELSQTLENHFTKGQALQKVKGKQKYLLMKIQENLIQAAMRERLIDKLPYFKKVILLLVSPNEEDKKIIGLPHNLSFLYFFIRSMRVLLKFLRIVK